jgi:septum formation protein
MKIILGSASPWRKKLMTQAGYVFTTMAADIDEKAIRNPNPNRLVRQLAQAKAKALLKNIPGNSPSLLITSDQVVFCNDEIREKPIDETQAKHYLQSYAQHPATTYTAVTVTHTQTMAQITEVDLATVFFNRIPDAIIDLIIKQGDIFACAGGFQVEGNTTLSPYVKKIDGDIDSVKGLPMALLKTLLAHMGYDSRPQSTL